jgi:hypothetical protein
MTFLARSPQAIFFSRGQLDGRIVTLTMSHGGEQQVELGRKRIQMTEIRLRIDIVGSRSEGHCGNSSHQWVSGTA